MKIAERIPRESENHQTKFSTNNQKHLIPFDSSDDAIADKDSVTAVTFALRTQPADIASPTHKFCIRKFEGGKEVCALITWCTNTEKVLNGLNITEFAPAMPIVEAILGGTALVLHQTGVEKAKEAHVETHVPAAPNVNAGNIIIAHWLESSVSCVADK